MLPLLTYATTQSTGIFSVKMTKVKLFTIFKTSLDPYGLNILIVNTIYYLIFKSLFHIKYHSSKSIYSP